MRALLGDPGKGAATEKATGTGTRAVARETESRVVIETQERHRQGAWIHQSYLKK